MKKHNRIIAGIMAVCLMGGVAVIPESIIPTVSITASAVDKEQYTYGTYEKLSYCNYGDHIEITGCDKSATEVVIPEEIHGVKVTKIENSAFSFCNSLTSVTIPDGVTSIGHLAFCNCTGLTKITFPDSITSIDWCAFDHSGLTEVIIPDNLKNIGDNAFYGTPWLEEREKENPLVIVNDILIEGGTCSGDIVIPDNVTIMGDGVFMGNKNLTSVTIPDSVISICQYSFQGCESLTSITIPDSVTSIGDSAFFTCKNLTEITILNPECEIYDSKSTISDTATIYGYENSTAQAYAEKYSYKFEVIGNAPEKNTATGDMNGDNELNVSDLVLLQKYLFGTDDTEISDWKQADLNDDGVLDIFDLCLMRKKLIGK